MTDRWVCPVQLTPHPGPFAAGSTPQTIGAVPESYEHDKKFWEASVFELRLPDGDINNATTSNPVFYCSHVRWCFISLRSKYRTPMWSQRLSVCDLFQRLDGLMSFYEIWYICFLQNDAGQD
jgi:hypothetical protein